MIQINAPYGFALHGVPTYTCLLEPVSIYHRILVAVDLTESSFTIAECGRALAAALGSDLEILHVVEPPPVVARCRITASMTAALSGIAAPETETPP